ncbi:MAG TPA: hypothetical protein VM327_06470, partial [Candidatus Thermoplasmatota archaeon]|nr:hypothetical protein [Candidatus Thermoplasmatota archaeon]
MRALLSVLLVAVLLGGCFGMTKTSDPATGPDAVDLPVAERPVTPTAFATYLHDVSQPIEGVSFATAIVEQYRTPIDE